jgi:hypothetical protein
VGIGVARTRGRRRILVRAGEKCILEIVWRVFSMLKRADEESMRKS